MAARDLGAVLGIPTCVLACMDSTSSVTSESHPPLDLLRQLLRPAATGSQLERLTRSIRQF
jgi:hypothetical protein